MRRGERRRPREGSCWRFRGGGTSPFSVPECPSASFVSQRWRRPIARPRFVPRPDLSVWAVILGEGNATWRFEAVN